MARISRGRHAHQTVLSNDPTKDISANQWNDTGSTAHLETGVFGFPTSVSSVSLASNLLTPVDTTTIVKASSGTSDTLNFIDTTGNNNLDIMWLTPFSGHTITVAHNASSPPAGSAAIILLGAQNKVLDANVPTLLVRNNGSFYETSLNANIINANVASNAAIAYSKLNLATSILNSDISNSAAIAASKINGTAGVLNGTQTWTGSNTFSPSTTVPITITYESAPVGSSTTTAGLGILVSSSTVAYATTPQTGNVLVNNFGVPTLTNPSAGTIPVATTVFINGAPVAGTNVTITNSYALYVNSGASLFQSMTVAGTLTMSGANISFGSNSIVGQYDTISDTTTVSSNETLLFKNNGANGTLVTIGSGTTSNVGLQLARTTDITTNYSMCSLDIDFSNSAAWSLGPIKGGSGSLFTMYFQMGKGVNVMGISTTPSILMFYPITIYNNINTAGIGVVAVYGATKQKAETGADANVLTYTPPGTAGRYRVGVSISCSAANTATLGWTITYTDANGHAQTPTNLSLFTTGTAAPATTVSAAANTTYYGEILIDIDNSATNIVVKTTFSGTSIAYKITAIVEQAA